MDSKIKLKVGDKVRVKAGLGIVSGWEGYIIEIRGNKAWVDFPYVDIRWIFLEDLELVRRNEQNRKNL